MDFGATVKLPKARTGSPSSKTPSLTTRPAWPDINDSIVSATVDIIAANPWAVLVSCTDEALLASHIPVILDREGERCSDISRELIHIRGC